MIRTAATDFSRTAYARNAAGPRPADLGDSRARWAAAAAADARAAADDAVRAMRSARATLKRLEGAPGERAMRSRERAAEYLHGLPMLRRNALRDARNAAAAPVTHMARFYAGQAARCAAQARAAARWAELDRADALAADGLDRAAELARERAGALV